MYRRIRGLFENLSDEQQTETSPYGARNSGEIKKCVYDFLSLETLSRKMEFREVLRKTYKTSDIPDWDRFQLDRSAAL